jgi:hypothetical protein
MTQSSNFLVTRMVFLAKPIPSLNLLGRFNYQVWSQGLIVNNKDTVIIQEIPMI